MTDEPFFFSLLFSSAVVLIGEQLMTFEYPICSPCAGGIFCTRTGPDRGTFPRRRSRAEGHRILTPNEHLEML